MSGQLTKVSIQVTDRTNNLFLPVKTAMIFPTCSSDVASFSIQTHILPITSKKIFAKDTSMWKAKLNFRRERAGAPNAETFFSSLENVIVDMDDCSQSLEDPTVQHDTVDQK